MSYIDFSELKSRVSILEVALYYRLAKKGVDIQLRCKCPVCNSNSDRALVITPSKGVFYCHEAKVGGDCIALVSHIKGIGMKEAALLIDKEFPKEEPVSEPSKFEGLSYLQFKHDLVQELGFDTETSEKLGIGYAGKGLMRGKVAIPIRLPNGTLVGYIGVIDAKLPKDWKM